MSIFFESKSIPNREACNAFNPDKKLVMLRNNDIYLSNNVLSVSPDVVWLLRRKDV